MPHDRRPVNPRVSVERVLVVQSVLNARKPPGSMLRYDGRLYTPSACVHTISVRVAIVIETSKETAPATDAMHRLPTRWTYRYDMMCTD
jgi:hypothetical protein